MHPRVKNFFTHHDFCILECVISRVFIPGFPGKNMIRMGTRSMCQIIFIGDVFAQHRRIG